MCILVRRAQAILLGKYMSDDYLKPLDELKEVETKAILKASALAHRALGELKGLAMTMPNQNILISTLSLQEAKESSEIENIITTQDDLYQSNYSLGYFRGTAAKEVHNYAAALDRGFHIVKETGLLTNNSVIEIQSIIEENSAGFRTQAGTSLINQKTNEIVFTPPQSAVEIINLMNDLEKFINNDRSELDDLIKMSLIHHRFETIHPFYDGNGRTGRILNVLFLTKQGLLDTPILYLSRFINRSKSDYYRLLQKVRDTGEWEPWILYILKAVEQTAEDTSISIKQIVKLMGEFKVILKEESPKIYSHELINNLFKYPYTKIEYIVNDLGVHRNSARKYLDELCSIGLLEKHKRGKENYYLNLRLLKILSG